LFLSTVYKCRIMDCDVIARVVLLLKAWQAE
jgi:hypothetical protein